MLEVNHVSKVYSVARGKKVTALKDCNLSLPGHGLVMILGPSGCGKTTLLNLIGTLDKPTSGEIVLVEGNRKITLSDCPESNLDSFRNRELGIVFQNCNLIENWDVKQNIKIALEQQSWKNQSIDEENQLIQEVLQVVELQGMEDRKLQELSGGERQRVAIARALVKDPSLILADEPTGNLDRENSELVLRTLQKCAETCLVIMVTHDAYLAEKYAERIIEIRYGEIVSDRLNMSISVETGKKPARRDSVEPKRLRQSTVTRLALNSIRVKKIKLMFMILTMLLVLAVIKISATLVTMNFGKMAAHYMTSNRIRYFQGYEVIKCSGGESFEADFLVRNRSAYRNFLEESFGTENVYPVISGITVTAGKGDSLEDCRLVVGGEGIPGHQLNGKIPTEKNEIVITDYAALIMGLSEECVGSEITVNHAKMIVCGIINLNAEELMDDIESENMEEIEAYGLRFLVSTDYYSYQKEQDFLSVPFANLQEDSISSSSCEEKMVLENSESTDEVSFCWGRLPNMSGEIAISDEYAASQLLMDETGEMSEREAGFVNLQFPENNQDPDLKLNAVALDGYLNLYSILPKITIVGVYESSGQDADILLCSSDYKNVNAAYCDRKTADSYETVINTAAQENSKLYNRIYQAGISFDMGIFEKYIDEYESYVFYRWILKIVIVGMSTLLILLLICFFSFNVKDNYHRIGVLRALGVTYPQIARIWLSESCIICGILEVCSVILNCFIVRQLNSNFCNRTGITPGFLYLNFWTEALTLFGLFASVVLTVMIPIWLVTDKKPIDLIRKNE